MKQTKSSTEIADLERALEEMCGRDVVKMTVTNHHADASFLGIDSQANISVFNNELYFKEGFTGTTEIEDWAGRKTSTVPTGIATCVLYTKDQTPIEIKTRAAFRPSSSNLICCYDLTVNKLSLILGEKGKVRVFSPFGEIQVQWNDKLLQIPCTNSNSVCMLSETNYETLHNRYNHANPKVLREMFNVVPPEGFHCNACERANLTERTPSVSQNYNHTPPL